MAEQVTAHSNVHNLKNYSTTDNLLHVNNLTEEDNKRIFRNSSTKDLNKKPDATVLKSPGYDLIEMAASDCSMDPVEQGYERLSKQRMLEKAGMGEDVESVVDGAFQEPPPPPIDIDTNLKQIKFMGDQSIHKLQIMAHWGHETAAGVQGKHRHFTHLNIPADFDTMSAINFIADGDQTRGNMLYQREKDRLRPELKSAELPASEDTDYLMDIRNSGLLDVEPNWEIINDFDAKMEHKRLFRGIEDQLRKNQDMQRAYIHKLDVNNIIPFTDEEEGDGIRPQSLTGIKSFTPLFGQRVIVTFLITPYKIPCKLLYDTGANCVAFSKSFLNHVEGTTKQATKVGPKVNIDGFAASVEQETTMLEMSHSTIPISTTVAAIIADRDLDKDFDGIFGMNTMATFHLGIEFPRFGPEAVLVYHAEDGTRSYLDTKITEDDDDQPIEINQLFGRKRGPRQHDPYAVVADEQINIVPGKAMAIRCRVVNFSKEFKDAKRNHVGMYFKPGEGFAVLAEGSYDTDETFFVYVSEQGQLANNDSEFHQEYTKTKEDGSEGKHYYEGVEDHLMARSYDEGHIIGRAFPLSSPMADLNLKEFQQVKQEGKGLEASEVVNCVCKEMEDRSNTVVLLGDKHGFNYQKWVQVVEPRKDFEDPDNLPNFRQRGNVIALKKRAEEDKYDLEISKYHLTRNIIIMTAYKEDLTPGQLAAIHELKTTLGPGGSLRILRQDNKKCPKCGTLACQYADPQNPQHLLSGIDRVNIYYSKDGTKAYDNSDKKCEGDESHVYTISGCAKIQCYKLGGVLKILVHLFFIEGDRAETFNMMYVQAYLLNQLRILRVPKNMRMFVGWETDQNSICLKHRLVSCMLACETWIEEDEWYKGDQESKHHKNLVSIKDQLHNCHCRSCKIKQIRPRAKLPGHIWAKVFDGNPGHVTAGAELHLGRTPEYYDNITLAKSIRAYAHCHSVCSHRLYMMQALHKEENAKIYSSMASLSSFTKAQSKSTKNEKKEMDIELIEERMKIIRGKRKREKRLLQAGGTLDIIRSNAQCSQIMQTIAAKELDAIPDAHDLAYMEPISERPHSYQKERNHLPQLHTKEKLKDRLIVCEMCNRGIPSKKMDHHLTNEHGRYSNTPPQGEIPSQTSLDKNLEVGFSPSGDSQKKEAQVMGDGPGIIGRLRPPDGKLIKNIETLEEDQGSTSTDDQVEKHIHTDASEFQASDIMGCKHQEDERWEDFITEEQYPKNPQQKTMFINIMNKYNSTFSKKSNAWRLMNIKPVHIKFKEDAPRVVHKYRPMSLVDDFVLTKKLDELLANELLVVVENKQEEIRDVTRLFLVCHNSEKKAAMAIDGIDKGDLENIDVSLYRVVADFRGINLNIYNAGYADYVMGTPQEIVARMGGFSHFISLDLKSAYRSVPIDAETKKRLTVRADCTLYRNLLFEFKSLIDGINIAPQLFTQILLKALQPFLDRVVIWIDDITIMERSAEKALELMEQVLEKLEEIKALVALNKMQVNVDFDENTGAGDGQVFGHMGWNIKLKVRKDKVLKKWVCEPTLCISIVKKQLFGSMEIPTCVREVQIRLGCANWLCDFLPYHTVNMAPFLEMLCKNAQPKWNPTQEMKEAWNLLMDAINNAPDLSIINYSHTLYIESDASLLGMGAVMSQNVLKDGVKSKNILGYYSKRFKFEYGTHNKYSSVFREVLGLVYATEHWKRYIYACLRTCLTVDIASIVHMAATKYIQDDAHLSRLIGKVLMLGTVFKIRHRPAKYSPLPDALSRMGLAKDANGRLVTLNTGVPIHHLRLTKEFLSSVPNHIPEIWRDEKTEITMREMVVHLCHQIGKNENLSPKATKQRYKSLLEVLHEKYQPIVQEWELKHGAPDVETAKVSTMVVTDNIGYSRRMAYVRHPEGEPTTQSRLIPTANSKGQVFIVEEQENEEMDPLLNFGWTNNAFLCRLQDMNPHVRELKYEILTTPVEQLDQRHKNFRLENSQLLVTREDKHKPFFQANRRIYLGPPEALYLLYYLHMENGHSGMERTRSYFKSYFETSYLSELCKIVASSCTPCQFYNPLRAKQVHKGRLPRKNYVGEMAYIDVAHFNMGFTKDFTPDDGRIKDQKQLVEHLMVIQDSYSGRTAICPIPGQETTDLVNAVKMYQMTQLPIQKIHCDNHQSQYSKEFYNRLKPYGVNGITYSMPNHSTSNARVERFIKTLREVAWKLAQFNKASSLWNVIYEANSLINNRPCEELRDYLPYYPSPPSRSDLYYGLPPRVIDYQMERHLENIQDAQDKIDERIRLGKVVDKYNHDMKEILEKRNNSTPLNHKIEKGDMVILANTKRIKQQGRGNPSWSNMVYQVDLVGDHGKMAKIIPCWGLVKRPKTRSTSHLKKVASNHCLKYMPPEIRQYYGSPFEDMELMAMEAPPSQFVNYLRKPPGTKVETRAQKQKLTNNKIRRQVTTGDTMARHNQVSENFMENASESDEGKDKENTDVTEEAVEAATFVIDDWANSDDYPENLNDQYADTQLTKKGKALGEDLQVMHDYYSNSIIPNPRAKAYFKVQEHKKFMENEKAEIVNQDSANTELNEPPPDIPTVVPIQQNVRTRRVTFSNTAQTRTFHTEAGVGMADEIQDEVIDLPIPAQAEPLRSGTSEEVPLDLARDAEDVGTTNKVPPKKRKRSRKTPVKDEDLNVNTRPTRTRIVPSKLRL